MYTFINICNTNTGDYMTLFNIKYIDLLDTFIRALLSLIVLFFITKLLGKKQVSQMSLFDYVIGISIGNFAAEMTINLDSQEMNGILAVVIFGFVAYFINFLSMKSIRLRRFVVGTPSILIEKGKFNIHNLRKYRMEVNDVLEQCRINGYFDISQIEYAILEANGDLSVLPKSKYRPVNTSDMKLKVKEEGLCNNIIIDGNIMYENLKCIGKSKDWLAKQLKVKGYDNFTNILLLTIDNYNNIKIYESSKTANDRDTLE